MAERIRHTHLTRDVRPEGECPACDRIWAAQRERLDQSGERAKAERSIAKLVERESKLGERRYGRRHERD